MIVSAELGMTLRSTLPSRYAGRVPLLDMRLLEAITEQPRDDVELADLFGTRRQYINQVANRLARQGCLQRVAWRSGTLCWVSVSHVVTDGSGLRNAVFFLGS